MLSIAKTGLSSDLAKYTEVILVDSGRMSVTFSTTNYDLGEFTSVG